MICAIKALLGDYLDRELHPDEKRRVESHLGECPGCRAELDELKALSNMVGGMPQASLPVGFMDRLERRRRSGAPARAAAPWRLPIGARAVAFAAASLLVTVVVYDRVKVMLSPSAMISGAASFPAPSEADLRLPTPSPGKNQPANHQDFAQSSLKAASAAKFEAKKAKVVHAPGAPIGVEETDALAKKDLEGAAADKAAISNESLQADLTRQQRLLGMRGIVAPDRHPMGQLAAAGAGVEQLAAAPSAAPVRGEVAALLEQPSAAGAVRAAAAEVPPPAVGVEGVAVRSETEREALWASRGMKAAPPTVDYAKRMLVVVFGTSELAVEIAAVKVGLGKTVVQYREIPLPPGADAGRAVPYQFRAVPRGDDVVFQKLP